MQKNITIVQIAKESGVSISTVSRVLNGTTPVAEETRRKVQAVIDKYHFSPNALARGLISRQSMMIGVMMPDITNPYFASMFREIESEARANGYSVFLCNTMYFSSVKDKVEEKYFQTLQDKQVDGLIVVGGQLDMLTPSDSYCKALRQVSQAIPTVAIGRRISGASCCFVERDNGAGIPAAIRHLIGQGHREIAFIGGEPGVTITDDRLAAYKAAMGAASLPVREELIALSDYYVGDGFVATNRLLSRDVRFTAAIAINDSVALGAMRALSDWGRSVPQDVALVSCDQFFSAAYMTPRLSSIDHHNELLARAVIRQLLAMIHKEENTDLPHIDTELVVRESSVGTPNRKN